jgi:hypothetical protein
MLALSILSHFVNIATDAAESKPRLMVMTDIGGDPDDEQSLVRFLLYACDFEVEGLCTGFGHGHYQNTRPDLIRKAVDAYGQVLPQLRRHRDDCNGKALLTPEVEPRPAADAVTSDMLTSFRYDRNLQVRLADLPAGTYAVFAYIFEDNNSEALTFAVEGRVVQRSYASGDAGHWRRLGPWIAHVSDGALDLTSQGGAANLSGIELWKMVEPGADAK